MVEPIEDSHIVFFLVLFFLVISDFSFLPDYTLEKMSEIFALDRRLSPYVLYPIHFLTLSRSSVSEGIMDETI